MTFEQIIVYLVGPLGGYLLGAIPFAFVIGKAHGVDIRKTGSGNIGATNLGRTLGKRFFWQAFFLDAAKGFLPVLLMSLLVRHYNDQSTITGVAIQALLHPFTGRINAPDPLFAAWSPLLTAAGCMLGHIFPIYLGFKGGKGVATGFGVVLGFWPLFTLAGLGAGLAFVIVLMIYRYISLASISGSVVFVLLVAAVGSWQNVNNFAYLPWNQLGTFIAIAIVFGGLIIFRHRSNIVRLYKGTEPQIGQREVEKAQMPERPQDRSSGES